MSRKHDIHLKVATDSQKVEAVCVSTTPTDLKHMRAFLGVTSYYQRFIHKFANPSHAFDKQGCSVCLGFNCQQALKSLKDCLTEASLFALASFDKLSCQILMPLVWALEWYWSRSKVMVLRIHWPMQVLPS